MEIENIILSEEPCNMFDDMDEGVAKINMVYETSLNHSQVGIVSSC